jgi:hypothetical protein
LLQTLLERVGFLYTKELLDSNHLPVLYGENGYLRMAVLLAAEAKKKIVYG